MRFYPDEIERIEDAELILRGVAPSEIAQMSLQQRHDVLEIAAVRDRLKYGDNKKKK